MLDKLYEMVKQFNLLAGLPQKFDPQSNEFWEQLDQQIRVVEEETKELRAAYEERNLVEVLDGAVDVFVTNSGVMDILQNSGVSVTGAGYEVCANNLTKMTQNPALAKKTVEMYDEQLVPTYIERKIVMDGIYPREWYTVRRVEDNKIMKPFGYQRVSLGKFVPGGEE